MSFVLGSIDYAAGDDEVAGFLSCYLSLMKMNWNYSGSSAVVYMLAVVEFVAAHYAVLMRSV
ncbi:MAG: hypothetical protein AAF512_00235 [Pseudomonadota bacterium]